MARKGKVSTIINRRDKHLNNNGTIKRSKLTKGQKYRYDKAVADKEFRISEEIRKPRVRRIINGCWKETTSE